MMGVIVLLRPRCRLSLRLLVHRVALLGFVANPQRRSMLPASSYLVRHDVRGHIHKVFVHRSTEPIAVAQWWLDRGLLELVLSTIFYFLEDVVVPHVINYACCHVYK